MDFNLIKYPYFGCFLLHGFVEFIVTVDSRKKMLGTFSPQQEPYTYELEEETTPSGIFARGTYAARTKVFYWNNI